MPNSAPGPGLRWLNRTSAGPAPTHFLGLYVLILTCVVVMHATLLRLPYFWDEGGYYVPAALDFLHHGTLIPVFTNAHPPLPNVLLAAIWRLFGFHIQVTRIAACAFAAGGLLAVFELTRRLLGVAAASTVLVLTAVYPIWYVQSSLAHADILAAAFTLGALGIYLTEPKHPNPPPSGAGNGQRARWTVLLFTLAVLSKETALLQPVVLAAIEGWSAFRAGDRTLRRLHVRWALWLCLPVPVLACWFAYHRLETGYIFGNPEFLRYNATANLTLDHLASSFWYRFLHLFWQRNIWVPIVLALACLILPRRTDPSLPRLSKRILATIAVLLVANWLAFSVLGGALLTRYLLPVYPLTLLVCVWIWETRTTYWPVLAAITTVAFVSAWWLNPPTYFAPEDNLTYRDMIVVHQEAIAYLQAHNPDATVLTAWPAAAELTRPELGYTRHTFKIFSVENFTTAEIDKAAAEPGNFDAALVFATHYTPPALALYMLNHPESKRGQKYFAHRDLPPMELAHRLGGRVVWEDDRNGEWAAVLVFDRRYNARLGEPPNLAP